MAERERSTQEARRHLDERLDEALEQTFPASDPPAMLEPASGDLGPEHGSPEAAQRRGATPREARRSRVRESRRSEQRSTYSRILVAVDGSAGADLALDHAARLARSLSATLRILHVIDLGWLPLEAELDLPVLAIGEAWHAAGEKLLARARDRAQAAGVEAEVCLREIGPAQRLTAAIDAAAADWQADVVVLGTHGRHGIERVVLGSVAEGVARRSKIPVLLVPPPVRS
jgi:nucleotide-binding universal stress UspA family protein